MECRVESLMRHEDLLEYEVGFTFPKRPYQEELEARILNLIDHQEDQVTQLEEDMRKTRNGNGAGLERGDHPPSPNSISKQRPKSAPIPNGDLIGALHWGVVVFVFDLQVIFDEKKLGTS
ncbi:hypothetical protein Tco_1270222 [Tanacetum coccineum]